MAKAKRRRGWSEAVCAAFLLLSYFMPWLYSMGTPVPAYQIRERLAGPHRLISAFSSASRISRNYELALILHAIPLAAGLVVVLVLLGRYRPWVGVLAGVAGLAAFFFLRGEVASFPFHRLAAGSYLALITWAALALSPMMRLRSDSRS